MTGRDADPAAAGSDCLWLPAPAKLNLFLHVTGRRGDGYHCLQTVFQLLDWGDRIGLEVTADGAIERHGGCAQVPAAQDLAVRAAHALRQEAGVGQGARIHIDKQIPAGAGLGGGSSDAATVLLGLDQLWGTGLGIDRLARLGATLGADVPVFVRGASAFAEGVGEVLTPVLLPERDFVVVWPAVGVSTAAIFQAPELTRNTPASTISALLESAQTMTCSRWPCPPSGDRPGAGYLSAHGPARMSGSGSAVFVPVADAPRRGRLPPAAAGRRGPCAGQPVAAAPCAGADTGPAGLKAGQAGPWRAGHAGRPGQSLGASPW